MRRPNIFTLESLRANCLITDSGCWLWQGYLEGGYARARQAGKKVLLHRISFELTKGLIPDGLEIDHLCRNKSCLNPEHLEAVSHKENTLRGISFSAINSRKKSCINGHPLVGDNLIIDGAGHRRCKICTTITRRKALKKFRAKKR